MCAPLGRGNYEKYRDDAGVVAQLPSLSLLSGNSILASSWRFLVTLGYYNLTAKSIMEFTHSIVLVGLGFIVAL